MQRSKARKGVKMELIQTSYSWLDPVSGIEYATDQEAAEARAEAD